jgi:hypothetical protein
VVTDVAALVQRAPLDERGVAEHLAHRGGEVPDPPMLVGVLVEIVSIPIRSRIWSVLQLVAHFDACS